MAFQQALSGLNSASKAIDTTSHNIANSSTVGYKSSVAHFGDVYAASLNGAGASQIGIGVNLAAVQQQFTQGNITSTNNPLDISINGAGFFRMDQNGATTFSRNGQFHLDKNGFVINDQGMKLTGYAAQSGIVVPSTPTPLQISASDLAPIATGSSTTNGFTGVKANINFDSRQTVPTVAWNAATPASIITAVTNGLSTFTPAIAPQAITDAAAAAAAAFSAGKTAAAAAADALAAAAAVDPAITAGSPAGMAITNVATGAAASIPSIDPQSYNYSTALSVYDTLGNPHTLTMYFEKVDPPTTPNTGEWRTHYTVDGTAEAYVTGSGGNLVFNNSGKLISPANGAMDLSINLGSVMGALGSSNSAMTPLAFKVDFTGSTQFGSAFGTNRLEQDGYAAGHLVGLSVGTDGIIQGRYSNGQTFAQGQVVLANFTNPNGLQALGNNQWAESSVSGVPIVGAPNTSNLGVLSSSTIEESNVDLTAELVNLITQQRNYQANAQSIKTQDQIMQTLVNLR